MTTFLIYRSLHAIAALFFGLAAYVQINDPDASIWIVMYILPAALSFGVFINPQFTENEIVKKINETIIVGYCIVGGFIIDTSYNSEDGFVKWIVNDEAGREFGGLALVSLWTGFMHGSARLSSTFTLLILSSIIIVPAAFWAYVYFDESIRQLWPKHCQSVLYPDVFQMTS